MTPQRRRTTRGNRADLVRLASRLAAPAYPAGRPAAWLLAGSAALAAIPVTVALAAPAGALGAGVLVGLAGAALPGATAAGWNAVSLREQREGSVQALCQAGADYRTARLLTAGRPALFSGGGALSGGLLVAVLRGRLGAPLTAGSPLRPALTADLGAGLAAAPAAAALAVVGTLLAVCGFWARALPALRQRSASRLTASLSESTTGTPAVSRTARLDEPPV